MIRIYYIDEKEVEPIKKFLVFTASFITLFIIFQILAGMFVTLAYTPDFSEAWSMTGSLPAETTILSGRGSFLLTLILATLSASLAYFISKKMSSKA